MGSKQCPVCGALVNNDSPVCNICGTNLGGNPDSQQAPQNQQPSQNQPQQYQIPNQQYGYQNQQQYANPQYQQQNQYGQYQNQQYQNQQQNPYGQNPYGQNPYGQNQYGQYQNPQYQYQPPYNLPYIPPSGKSKIVAGILALMLGSFGVHKFYLNKIGMGIVYILFFWTGIPGIAGIIEGIIYLCATDQDFEMKYVN